MDTCCDKCLKSLRNPVFDASMNGHLECLACALKLYYIPQPHNLIALTPAMMATFCDNLDCLVMLYFNGATNHPHDREIVIHPATFIRQGIDCYKFLIETGTQTHHIPTIPTNFYNSPKLIALSL